MYEKSLVCRSGVYSDPHSRPGNDIDIKFLLSFESSNRHPNIMGHDGIFMT